MKLEYDYTESGYCRVHFKAGIYPYRKYCIMQEGKGQFGVYECTEENEPSHPVPLDRFQLIELPCGDEDIDREVAEFIKKNAKDYTIRLSSLKEGDKVIYHSGGAMSGNSIETVSHVTKTMIMVGGHRFNRKNGYAVGQSSAWSAAHITAATEKRLAQTRIANRRKNLPFLLDRKNVALMSDEQINTLTRAIKEVLNNITDDKKA